MANKLDMGQNEAIKGVVIRKLGRFEDSRGWLSEVYRDDVNKEIKPAMCYVSYTKFGEARGPHEHAKQSDFFVFLGPGDFEVYLWDNRKDSATYGKHMKIVAGESNKISMLVPPGVVHGYKSISKLGSFSINLPDMLYMGEGKKGSVDEIRHENDKNSKFRIE